MKWRNLTTRAEIDNNGPITANGDYELLPTGLDASRPFIIGASATFAGSTGTVQLWAEVADKKVSIDSAMVPTFGVPVAGPNEYTLTGPRGITVSGISGTIAVEVSQ